MSERKVLNKYYPPDFDPNNIPRARRPKNQTFNIRLMAPFNMRCNTCGEYIYKGKKFNSRKENVENVTYLGIQIYRFYIKCPMCIAEISFRTDPVNTDYEIESGATRNFEALRTAERMAMQEEKDRKEAESNDPMKLLESRTKASRLEMEELEALEDLKELKRKQQNIDSNHLFSTNQKEDPIQKEMDEEEKSIEEIIKHHFGKVKRINKDNMGEPLLKIPKLDLKKNPQPVIKSKIAEKKFGNVRVIIKPKVKDDVKTEKSATNLETPSASLSSNCSTISGTQIPESALSNSQLQTSKEGEKIPGPPSSLSSSTTINANDQASALKLTDYSDSDDDEE